jgi:drug/metabolite transporter (DMT)-like permease
MGKPRNLQIAWGVAALLTGVVLIVVGLVAVGRQFEEMPSRGASTTRWVAIAFLLSDLAITSSLVTLLVTRERRAPAWIEERLPALGGWLWYLLLGLAILCYASLAPTFLYLYLHLKK